MLDVTCLLLAVLDVVRKNNDKATSSDLSGIRVSKRSLQIPQRMHPSISTIQVNTTVFSQFRRVDDQQVKWILPRPATSESNEESGDNDKDSDHHSQTAEMLSSLKQMPALKQIPEGLTVAAASAAISSPKRKRDPSRSIVDKGETTPKQSKM